MIDEWLNDATRFTTVQDFARIEAAARARRLAAMVAVLDACRAADGAVERERWYLDDWAAVAAQVGAEANITASAASHQLLIAVALRDRLPRVAAVFADGRVSYRAVEVIVWRTMPIANPIALAAVDAAMADALVTRAPLSEHGLAMAVDAFVDALDPEAIQRTERGAKSRGVTVHHDEAAGTAYLSCTLFGHEAWALEQLVDAVTRDAGRAPG
ncbi:DUF222 domain-containing protein [Mycolicibacterium lacusdiani]|uniref:DUF222 domain-containing protein n=1 Tax=Mycolicibacterium lacusdiani TaxID=2895283 RepID=UPI001F2DD5DD|nr:DUF222 domain-containing protein [Mycolicibacterium lacusdiani]